MPRVIHMPSKNRPSRKLKQRSIATHNWQHMTYKDKNAHYAMGSVFYVTDNSHAGLGMDDTYRLEWGVQRKNQGTMVVHGTAEQARALLNYAYAQLSPNETMVGKETVQALLRSFCSTVQHPHNKMDMWYITKEIPHADLRESQYQRAHSFLRSLVVRTLHNLYESVTGERIK